MEKQMLKMEDGPQFFKIFFGENVEQRLRIPPAFMKHLAQDMSNRATLTSVSGCIWRATVSTDENGTYLQKGWKEFAKENNLGDNEFLIFRYDGNMQFHVKIFDKSGVIRQPTPLGKRGRGRPRKNPVGLLHHHNVQLHRSEQESNLRDNEHLTHRCDGNMQFHVEIDKSGVERQPTPLGKRGRGRPRKNPVGSLHHHNVQLHRSEQESNLRDNEHLTHRCDGNMQFHAEIDKSGVERQPAPLGKRGRGRPRKNPAGSLDHQKTQLHHSEQVASQSSIIKNAALPFTSPFPHFMTGMTSHEVEKTFFLSIPRSFSAAAHFPPSKFKLVLRDSAGKAWDVICINGKGTHYLSGGWKSFALHNNLRKGDVCVFELVRKNEIQVHVL